jgi:hypothetical protein
MKPQLVCAALALGLAGCGGGGNEDSEITRALIAGTEGKTWRLAAIRGNINYEGDGVDTPCSAKLKKLSDPKLSFSCGSRDDFAIKPDGTMRAYFSSSTWSLSGSTLTLDLRSLGVVTSSVSLEPTSAGSPQRLRLRQLSRVVGGVRNPDEDGCELIIVEQDSE